MRAPVFEKTAARFNLSDNPNTYPSELIAHLYKQHPYLGKYKVNMTIEGKDESMGYMYGVFLVSHADETPPEMGTARMGETDRSADETAEKESQLRVPIIVENKKAYSFDVFITADGKFMPLNEQRVASALFDPSPYALAPKSEARPIAGASANFAPADPSRAHGGGAGAYSDFSGEVKQASVLDKVAAVVPSGEIDAFLTKVASDRSLLDALRLNSHFEDALKRLAIISNDSLAKTAAIEDPIEAGDPVVITKTPGGYSVKTASADGFAPKETSIPNEVGERLPLDIRQGIVDNGAVLLVNQDNATLLGVEKTAGLEVIAESGVYSVMTKAGKAERAAVVCGMSSLDGRELDMCLVVGPSGAALQEKVAGVRCGDINLDRLDGGLPSGEGIFVFKTAGTVSEPLEIKHTINTRGGTTYIYDHPLSGRGEIKTASVTRPVIVSDNQYLIPEDSVFVPLTFGSGYASDTIQIDKIASRADLMMRVRLVGDGSEFSLYGRPVFDKTAGLSKADALLVLGALGDTYPGAMTKLSMAEDGKSVEFVARAKLNAPRRITREADEVSNKIAQAIRADLTKEAAVLTNTDTVDSVLSLNFITPENIQGYVDAIPDIEAAGSRLAELLVGVRLGLSDVPETAVSSALRGIERALQGLKKLQMRADVIN